MTTDSVTAFAPATVGNVGIGFDILGHTVKAVGDRVTARRTAGFMWPANNAPNPMS